MKNNNNIKQVHREAMKYAQEALIAIENGDIVSACVLYEKAFDLEKQAAYSFILEFEKEPTRSILFRSAASLAINCKKYEDAEKMITQGLAGNPPTEIANELRNLYESVNFYRHLELHNIQLSSTEIQIALSGNEVGYGIINSEELLDRYKKFELLTYRTAERRLKKPYNSGKTNSSIKERFQPYISVFRAASFAFTVRLGRSENPQLTLGFDSDINIHQSVLDEIVENMKLINEERIDELKSKINDDDYFQNFMSLTKGIAPDGDKVTQIGFTIIRNGSEVQVGLLKTSNEIKKMISPSTSSNEDIIQIEGILKLADAEKNRIKLVKDDNSYVVDVPEGLSDIVKLHWEDLVRLTVSKKKSKYLLIDIEKNGSDIF